MLEIPSALEERFSQLRVGDEVNVKLLVTLQDDKR